MPWTKIADIPATRLYEDEHGNIRRISLNDGQFISGIRTPDYGEWGFGKAIRLSAEVVGTDTERSTD